MNQFCEMNGILRQFSVAKTSQQNRVAKRRNRTLIEAVRTMLADSKLPTTFWAKAVNITRYVQNRVLVVKPHNKTSQELFHGRTPTLSFIRPFRCPITILNTIDHLGKFDGKADEGFFVRYSFNSKAFRVFNSRTRIVEENLHIRFCKSTTNVVGSGSDWLFDIDVLTTKMNYEPIIAGAQSNAFASIKAKKEDNVNNTNNVNTVSSTINTTSTNEDNKLLFDPNMLALEDVSTFDFTRDDEDDVAVADMNNLDKTIQIKEEVYICQPPGFKDPDIPDRVYKVEKVLYGLHQAPRALFTEVKTASTLMETQKPLLKDEDGEEVYQVNLKVSYLYDVKMIFSATGYTNTVELLLLVILILLDGKKIIITKASIRRDLQLADEEDGVVHKELGDSLVRDATIVSSLEAKQDSGKINKTQSNATPNESSSQGTNLGGGLRGNTLQSDENRMKLNELMALCTTLQNKGRIEAIDADEDITLVNDQDNADKDMFDVNVLDGEEVFAAAGQNKNVVNITTEEFNLAQALKALKTSKSKVKGLVIQDPEHVKPKNKDQIRVDEEAAKRLQAEFDEEARLAREKVIKEQEANIALIEEWNDIQAKIDVNYQLAKKLQERIVRIKILLDAVGITAAQVFVNTALMKLVLLRNFKKIFLVVTTAGVKTVSESYYGQYKEVTAAQVKVSAAQELQRKMLST
nr:retrovirus-related Pol polyprotein from transposon TNT 1-94 [Tanacetum cinerariifolium]